MNNKIEIDSDKKISEIRDNLFRINEIIVKKIIYKKNLKYKKNSISLVNLNKSYSSIANSPHNLFLRFFRFLKKNIFLILLIFSISLIAILTLIYYYQIELLIFFMINNIDTTYLLKFINIVDKLFLFINNYYLLISIYISNINYK